MPKPLEQHVTTHTVCAVTSRIKNDVLATTDADILRSTWDNLVAQKISYRATSLKSTQLKLWTKFKQNTIMSKKSDLDTKPGY